MAPISVPRKETKGEENLEQQLCDKSLMTVVSLPQA